jgi:hypothetical protein
VEGLWLEDGLMMWCRFGGLHFFNRELFGLVAQADADPLLQLFLVRRTPSPCVRVLTAP